MRGEGARLWDADGKEYLDFFAGLSVHNAGHCHPRIVAAIAEQVGTLRRLVQPLPLGAGAAPRRAVSRVAASAARSSSATRAPRRRSARSSSRASTPTRATTSTREIVSLDGGFHGRTLGALAATPSLADDEPLRPAPARASTPSRATMPTRCVRPVRPETAAVMIEPIQGEAGIFPIADEVLVAAREACDAVGALLIFDEVQTGMGRTGSLWAHEQLPVTPDVMTAAKALGGGLPVGAVVTGPRRSGTSSSRATTARPSLAAPSVPPRRWAALDRAGARKTCLGRRP